MAVIRDRPYVQFNFLVYLGTGKTKGPVAGFQEISGISMEIVIADQGQGNEKVKRGGKKTVKKNSTEIFLKQGVIDSRALEQWLNDIRLDNQKAMRMVTITRQNEDHSETVQTWRLRRARIIKHTSGPLNAKGTDVAIEEMVLAYERLEME
jgi:phage tail-like protein